MKTKDTISPEELGILLADIEEKIEKTTEFEAKKMKENNQRITKALKLITENLVLYNKELKNQTNATVPPCINNCIWSDFQ